MKKPQIDLHANVTQEYLNKVRFKKKFLRLWGHNGTVLNKKHRYYPRISPNDVELFKLLGIYKDLKEAQDKMEGIDKAWIYLNPKKIDVSTLSDELLIQELEFDVPDGIYTINITPNVTFQRTHYFYNGPMTKTINDVLGLLEYSDLDTLGSYIESNYAQVLDKYIVESAEEDALTNLVAMHILNGSNAFSYNIKSVEYGLVEKIKKVAINRSSEDEETRYTSYKYTTKSITIDIEIKQTGIVSDDDPLVASILTQREKDSASSVSDSAQVTRSRLSSILQNRSGVTNDVWLDGQMRVELFDPKTLKTKDLIPLIQGSLDSDYKKKKTKWYKKLLAIVVFVVAFYFSGGTSAASLGAFATSFTIATLAVTVLSTAMSAWGDDTGAGFVSKFASKLNIVGTFIGFAAIVQSVSTAITKQIAAETAKIGVAEAAKQGTTSMFIKAVKNLVVKYFKSALTKISLENTITVASRIFKMYSNNKLEGLQDRLKTVEQENAETSQYEEEGRSRDIGLSLIKSHGEMFHQDSTDKYDYPYESWNSPMHIGNICRTSWKWERTGNKITLSGD